MCGVCVMCVWCVCDVCVVCDVCICAEPSIFHIMYRVYALVVWMHLCLRCCANTSGCVC